MTEQIDNYFTCHKLVTLIQDELQSRIDNSEIKLFLFELLEFVGPQTASFHCPEAG